MPITSHRFASHHLPAYVRDSMQNNPTPPDQPEQKENDASGAHCLDSSEILKGSKEVLIRHGEETYRLRLTRNGKLILHK